MVKKTTKNSKVQISTGLRNLLKDYEICRLEILDRNNKVLASGGYVLPRNKVKLPE